MNRCIQQGQDALIAVSPVKKTKILINKLYIFSKLIG